MLSEIIGPLIPKPMDQTALLPTPNEEPIKIELAPAPAVPWVQLKSILIIQIIWRNL